MSFARRAQKPHDGRDAALRRPADVRARFGSIFFAQRLWSVPASNRSCAANAIIAALSVERERGAATKRILAASHAASNCARNALLQLTPPLSVTAEAPEARAAPIVLRTRTSIATCWKDAHKSLTTLAEPSASGAVSRSGQRTAVFKPLKLKL